MVEGDTEPVASTRLAAAADIEDNGRLNYHLRRSDTLIDRSAAGYTLSETGTDIVASVLPVTTAAEEKTPSPSSYDEPSRDPYR